MQKTGKKKGSANKWLNKGKQVVGVWLCIHHFIKGK